MFIPDPNFSIFMSYTSETYTYDPNVIQYKVTETDLQRFFLKKKNILF